MSTNQRHCFLVSICFPIIFTLFHLTLGAQVSDLVPTQVVGPSESAPGGRISVKLSGKNQGLGAASEGWILALYLSPDNQITPRDLKIGHGTVPFILPPGRSGTITIEANIPTLTAPGSYYLGVIFDLTNVIRESNEANNIMASTQQIVIKRLLPDLVPKSVDLFQYHTLLAGADKSFKIAIKNEGQGLAPEGWTGKAYLTSIPPSSGSIIPPPPSIFAIEIFLGSFTVSAPLSAGSEITLTLDANIPLKHTSFSSLFEEEPLEGYFYVKVTVDTNNFVVETNEYNNTFTDPVPYEVRQPPDLVPVSITGPTSASAGQEVTIDIDVANYGDGDLWGSWVTGIYLVNSSDSLLIERYTDSGTIYSNTYKYTIRTLSLPSSIAAGIYHWQVVVDEFYNVKEINAAGTAESNNTRIGYPVNILPIVDLIPLQIQGPVIAIQGSTIPLDWSIMNQGTGQDQSNSIALVVISSDNIIDSTDIPLITKTLSPVAPNSTISATESVVATIDPGSYYLGIIADATNAIQEIDENNNIKIADRQINITPPPDLVPLSIDGPNQATPGDAITITSDVTNHGLGTALEGWTRNIYLSTDAVITSEDIILSTLVEDGQIPQNVVLTYKDNLTIPAATPNGTYYLGLVLKTPYPETNTDNNIVVSTRAIRLR